MKIFISAILPFTIVMLLLSCNLKVKNGLLVKKTSREKYEEKVLKDSGKMNPLVNAWLNAAESSLNNPLKVTGNFAEKGRFFNNDSSATSYLIDIKRGQRMVVSLDKITTGYFNVYMDLWEAGDTSINKLPSFIAAADTMQGKLEYAATRDERIVIRFQKELYAQGDYEFEIKTGPAFGFPISPLVKSNIGSLWGDARDAGVRKHEGIDIFAPNKSPVVAIEDGIITGVSENELGGKVVFLQPAKTNYNVYYAHLDSQLVTEGQLVIKGQTLGLVGNTGNARTTIAHLHLGIYTVSGAIDPLLFVKPQPNQIKANTSLPLKNNFITLRSAKFLKDINTKTSIEVIAKNSAVKVHAVAGNYYRVTTFNGSKGFVLKNDLKQL